MTHLAPEDTQSSCKRFVVTQSQKGTKACQLSRFSLFLIQRRLSFYLSVSALSLLYITSLFARFTGNRQHALCSEKG